MIDSETSLQKLFTRAQVTEALSSLMSESEAETLLLEHYDKEPMPVPADIRHKRNIRGFFSREEMTTALCSVMSSDQAEELLQRVYDLAPEESAWHLDQRFLDALAKTSPSLAERVAYVKTPPNPLLPITIKYWIAKTSP